MKYGLRTALALSPVLAALTASPCALADGVVNVVLQDASDGGDISGMKMTAAPDSVKAGPVTIHAANQSKGLVHEVIVVRSPNGAELPYDEKSGEIVEKNITRLGEVSDLQPGRSGSLALHLTPGSYLLVCNQPNHYKAGMWTRLTVFR